MEKERIRQRLARGCRPAGCEGADPDVEGCVRATGCAEAGADLCAGPGDSGTSRPVGGGLAQGRGRLGVPAAVLVGLVHRPGGLCVIFTKRTDNLGHHPGQISFPGGHTEAQDASPEAAALREAQEEIGLPPERVEVLGRLPLYRTISNFWVTPVVGWIESAPPLVFVIDQREVAEVFEVPLDFFLDPGNRKREFPAHGQRERSYFVYPYPGHRIWGATAGMLACLAHILTS